MELIPIVLTLPRTSKEAVEKITDFFNSDKVKSSSLKIEMERSLVDKSDIGDYIDILLDQFKDADDATKAKIKKLKFDSQDSLGFSFKNQTSNGRYNITMIVGKKEKFANGEVKYKIFMFYYDKSCEYTSLTSWWRSLFGFSSKNIDTLITEDNIKSFLVYKLAKYAQEFDKGIRIEYADQNNNLT